MNTIALSKNVNLIAALGVATNDKGEQRLKVWAIAATEANAASAAAVAFAKAHKLSGPTDAFVESLRFHDVKRLAMSPAPRSGE